jgi:hypothetical protein
MAIEEVIPGVHHWTQIHPRIEVRVHSHFIGGSGTLIDPLIPDEGIEWFDGRGVERVVLSNRHHLRHAERFAERFGCPILCHEAGLHEFAGGPEVAGYAPGERLADDVTAVEMDAICPDDAGLAIEAGDGALLFADAIVNHGAIGFVSDRLIGDDPEPVKRQVRERAAALCSEREFEHLLFAHGDPVIGSGREELRRFAAGR